MLLQTVEAVTENAQLPTTRLLHGKFIKYLLLSQPQVEEYSSFPRPIRGRGRNIKF